MPFELRALPLPGESEPAYWFAFSGDKLLLELQQDLHQIPYAASLSKLQTNAGKSVYLGRYNGLPCFATDILPWDDRQSPGDFIPLRQVYGLIEEELFWLAARGYHLISWDRNSDFCGCCGAKNLYKEGEHSKYCPQCGLSVYPKISPAVIVAITKGNKLLLAQNVNNKNKFYSVLAGFVEPGESLEGCLRREIMEEAGIEVKNIQYFGSQPWPFPDSLMVGFTAEYAGGELKLDQKELCDAGWFTADHLPHIPGKISISGKLIQWFIEKNGRKNQPLHL
jgi:NAD+ diphosphatase